MNPIYLANTISVPAHGNILTMRSFKRTGTAKCYCRLHPIVATDRLVIYTLYQLQSNGQEDLLKNSHTSEVEDQQFSVSRIKPRTL